jgi:hypothetical protein
MIYRRLLNLQSGDVDDSDYIWGELQRIRSHAMKLDHTNFKDRAVLRSRIVDPDDTDFNGASITVDNNGFFAADATAGSVTLTESNDDGIWRRDTATTIAVRSRHDAVWLVGFSANFINNGGSTPTGTQAVAADLRVHGSAGPLPAWVVGHLNSNSNAAAVGGLSAVVLPAGEHILHLAYRLRYSGYPDDVDYQATALWAVGMVA